MVEKTPKPGGRLRAAYESGARELWYKDHDGTEADTGSEGFQRFLEDQLEGVDLVNRGGWLDDPNKAEREVALIIADRRRIRRLGR